MSKALCILACDYVSRLHLICIPFQTQIGLVILLIVSLPVGLWCTWDPTWSRGSVRSNALSPDHLLRLNIYKALGDVFTEVTWIVSLLRELGIHPLPTHKLWCDNLGVTFMCANPVFHARIKHVEIDYHFVRDKVASGELKVNFISRKDHLTDIFTKPLPTPWFVFLRDKLRVVGQQACA